MALKKIPYGKASLLIKDYLSTVEDEETAQLIRQLRRARTRGYLTLTELEAVCRWKSARAIRHIKSNSPSKVRDATRKAFATRSERQRLEELTNLGGVSVPMASAILMLCDPRRYGVIDIRVWQLLYAVGAVTKKSSGIGFNFNNWYQFLMIIRYFSKKLGVTARNIESTLFLAHKDHQQGLLYSAGSRHRRRSHQVNRTVRDSALMRFEKVHVRSTDLSQGSVETRKQVGSQSLFGIMTRPMMQA